MRYAITIIFVFVALAGVASPYSNQSEPQRYNYKVTGRVIFNRFQSKRGATVYVFFNGASRRRIPFAHADKDGRFSIKFTFIPGEYRVYSHEGETGGLLPLAATLKSKEDASQTRL